MRERMKLEVTAQFEAVHKCPENVCKDDSNRFLTNSHRHVFYVRLQVITMYDRQVEFLVLKKELQSFIRQWHQQDLGTKSCEEMCKNICLYFQGMYKICLVSVFEDNENGAILEIDYGT